MLDVAAYALLKRGITTAGTTTGATITDARIEDGHLILIMSDGTTIDAGVLPTGTINNDNISNDTTWSSARIVEYIEETLKSKTPTNIVGGSANFETNDILSGD